MSFNLYKSRSMEGSAKAALLLGTIAGALLFAGTGATRADEHMVLVDKIVVPQGTLPEFHLRAWDGPRCVRYQLRGPED